MAALRRRAVGWYQLISPNWATIARQTCYLGEQRRTTASFLRPLITASRAGSPEDFSCGRSRKYMQEPECRTDLPQCLLEKPETPVDGGASGLEVVTSSLRDMGFSDAHIGELLSVHPSASLQQLLDVTSELLLLGLDPEPVCVVLKKSPQLLKLSVNQMKKRSSYLRKLGLGEGRLKRVLSYCPEILTVHQRGISDIVGVLRERCLFTVQQVTEILHRCPCVLREDPGELEYKFQYAYFRMGIKQPDVVRTDFLQYSITKIKQRHIYLERLGRYQTPDKKGQTQVPNPALKDIFRVSEAEFLAKVARSSAEEFEVFKKLLSREEEEGPEGYVSDGDNCVGDGDVEEDITDGQD